MTDDKTQITRQTISQSNENPNNNFVLNTPNINPNPNNSENGYIPDNSGGAANPNNTASEILLYRYPQLQAHTLSQVLLSQYQTMTPELFAFLKLTEAARLRKYPFRRRIYLKA